ncbi:hypothetical protein BHM03_00039599 [Ensete ventricosum]|uniref:Uncharacterized protein n=1 Tax=Ensete ventricosum TaxID=4639 RepID=A0A445MK52_ENSVE|nr:hypothetical protein BHM03_00039599 [Ensete ventricosum]
MASWVPLCPSPPSPSLRRHRRCPYAGGGCPLRSTTALLRGSHPCDWLRRPCWRQGLPLSVGPCRLAVAGRALGWPPLVCCYPCGRPHLAGGLAVAGRPLQVVKPWLAATARGLAVASHLCMQTAWMWPPLPHRQRLLSLPITTTSAEIVYPSIPDSDREDEGGQASNSLAISTRWISAVELLQSDLATLAQKERGE